MTLRTKTVTVCVLAALFAGGATGAQAAGARDALIAQYAPPTPYTLVVPIPKRGYIYAPGYWKWNGRAYLWVDGQYLRDRKGWIWVQDRWEDRNGKWHRVPGHWERG